MGYRFRSIDDPPYVPRPAAKWTQAQRAELEALGFEVYRIRRPRRGDGYRPVSWKSGGERYNADFWSWVPFDEAKAALLKMKPQPDKPTN